jgi:hypothetical protein
MAITKAWVEEMAQLDRENALPQAARLAIFYGCKPDIRPLKEDVLASASRIAAQRGMGKIDARIVQNVGVRSAFGLGLIQASGRDNLGNVVAVPAARA